MVGTMSEQLTVPNDALPVESPPKLARVSQRLRWFELVLVLSISFGQYVFGSLYLLSTGQVGTFNRPASQWAMGLFQEATSLALLGYVLWRRKLRFPDIGLRWSNADILRGVGVAVGAYLSYTVGSFVVWESHRSIFGAANGGLTAQSLHAHPGIIAIPFSLLNPLFEELIVRAFLMTEIIELTGSAALAVGLSVLLQTSYHLYYGWQGALSLAFQFVVFALYFAKTRRATPIILAHGAFDLLWLVRFW
jgi:membrane protease YdiL (CAAX protease family)